MWFWRCTYEKGGGPWSDPDHECCGAYSRKGFESKELAEAAAKRHYYLVWHSRKKNAR